MAMIDGVVVKPLKVWRDIPDTPVASGQQLGFLMEVLRDDDGLLSRFGQSTFTVAYHGTIKAFHWHKKQDDVWFVASGKAGIVLYDMRPASPTYGITQVIFAGTDDYKTILIPLGVAHGYKVLSTEPVLLFYHTTQRYDAKDPDEQRIAHDDPSINFNWSTLTDSI